MPDEVLRQLADLAHVPTEQREFFFDSICMNVQTACELDELIKQGLAAKRGKKLVGAALALYDVLGNLNNRERVLIEGILGRSGLFDRISSQGMEGLEQTAYQLALLASLVTGKPPPRYPSQPPEAPVPGRPAGTVKHWVFHNFAWDLWLYTEEAGGRLTIERNIRKGSFIEALKILADYLPEGVAAQRLSPSTLQRIKDLCSRAQNAADELDRDESDDLL